MNGRLILPHTYVERLDAELKECDTDMGSFAGCMRFHLREGGPVPSDYLYGDDLCTPPMWVDLTDAVIIEAGTPRKLGLWRGRTADVTG